MCFAIPVLRGGRGEASGCLANPAASQRRWRAWLSRFFSNLFLKTFDIRDGNGLVFEVDQAPFPGREMGLDWTRVEAIVLAAIEDDHGKRKKK